jgi:hypothetical protein
VRSSHRQAALDDATHPRGERSRTCDIANEFGRATWLVCHFLAVHSRNAGLLCRDFAYSVPPTPT